MNDIRNDINADPVVGRFTGFYTIDSGDPVNFDISEVRYASGKTTPSTLLRVGNAQMILEMVIRGGVSIEQPGYYPITGNPGELEAWVELRDDEFNAYEEPTGGLYVRFAEPDGDYKRLEGEGTIKMKIFDRKKNPHDLVVTIATFDVRTKPI